MESITSKVINGIQTITLSGRIDSANAGDIEKDVMECLKESHSSLVMDMEKLSYISSAGLRIILRVMKIEPTLKLVGVTPEVYEVFDMTGFSEMIPIEKAYRRLSVDGCEVIGQGANGLVYRLDPDTIIKVYKNPDALPDIKRERELARRAFVLGIPTAIPYDVVKVGDSFGTVFELLNATSFCKMLIKDPNCLDEVVKKSVEILKQMHSTTVKPEDMPDMKAVAVDWVDFLKDYLPSDKEAKLMAMVEAVPVSHKMLHGDYHIKNIMLQNNEVLLIDMDTLCQGDPIFELASVFNAYVGYSELTPNAVGEFLGLPEDLTRELWRRTLAAYLGTDDEARIQEVEDKARLLGHVRMMRRAIRRGALDNEDGKKAVANSKAVIFNLIDKVDSLTF